MHGGDTMTRILKRKSDETIVITFAKLIAIDKQGRVLLTQNKQGNYELPQTTLNKRQALEKTLREQTHIQTGVDIGTMSLWQADTTDADPIHMLEIIYTSEDLKHTENAAFFELDALPMNIEKSSCKVIENYNAKMKESFMHFVSAYGLFL